MDHLHARIAAILLTASLVGVSSAQTSDRISPALALARLCVSEAGWACWDTGDGYAIHEVLLRGADRGEMRYVSFARAYASRLLGARPHDSERLRWVAGLAENGSAPPAWPRVTTRRRGDHVEVSPAPPWAHYRDRWLTVLDQAREVVATLHLDDADEWSICEGDVHDWGGAMDRERAERNGLVQVDCGETRNDFYCRPSEEGCE